MHFIMRKINAIGMLTGRFISEKLKGTELNGSHTGFIFTLCKTPGISQDELCEILLINKSNVARQLCYLEEKGFVMRMSSEKDRRVLLVYPTKKAYDIIPKLKQIVDEWDSYLTKDFGQEEIEFLNQVVEKLSKKAKDFYESKEEV